MFYPIFFKFGRYSSHHADWLWYLLSSRRCFITLLSLRCLHFAVLEISIRCCFVNMFICLVLVLWYVAYGNLTWTDTTLAMLTSKLKKWISCITYSVIVNFSWLMTPHMMPIYFFPSTDCHALFDGDVLNYSLLMESLKYKLSFLVDVGQLESLDGYIFAEHRTIVARC